ncbi:TIGR03767 family metallophosphoesterase [Arthrobacter psychrochitiniphilus]|uniref:TIGR03767 family metallophosphoesterase n=1 Tax=Arthrobacter psychrochitiniphilus TaxID=291045 RepID=A0A2V3DQT8_9MICC|nr:TIGR03767 family metallophosphoesterase [Arthrobacter psychrochitiniphilus]NYG18137.1 metallophosphoesterase (TIGR03767 family) [Arthrobacter psychrochitiniphilus]PXA65051.1 TIGR03767 family metallophosphoesterase [Arthrobacter psychrochitiniphilus]
MQHNSAHLPSRRTFITGSALGLTALALAGCDRAQSPTPTPTTAPTPTLTSPTGAGTTLEARLVPGEKLDPTKPYRRLAADDGYALVVREDLCKGNPNRAGTRKALAAFGHITDTHILDPTSPAHTILGAFNTVAMDQMQRKLYYFRPQEALTVQVLDAMVRKLNAVKNGPVSGRPFDFYISTGDSSDNRGASEVNAFVDAMNGQKTSAFALPGRYSGLQSSGELPDALSRFIWQPVPPKSGSALWNNERGFPVVQHLLSSASKLITTDGSNVPWYSGFGNHDALVHDGVGMLGTPNESFHRALSTSDKIPLGLPPKIKFSDFMTKLNSSTATEAKALLESMPGNTVEASSLRRPMSKTEFMSAHVMNPGRHGPRGHGFTGENVRSGTAYYRFQLAPGIVGLMLDTTDTTGGGYGSLDAKQAAWLEKELNSISGIRYAANGTKVSTETKNQLAVIFSHHPSTTFSSKSLSVREKGDITSPESIQRFLGQYPNVILWVNGHLHKNVVWPRSSASGKHGFWEVSTASHIDFPQQARSVEVIDNRDGTLSIAGVMIDHSDAYQIDYSSPFTAAGLAAVSSELSMNAANSVGTRMDQNVELLLKKPF